MSLPLVFLPCFANAHWPTGGDETGGGQNGASYQATNWPYYDLNSYNYNFPTGKSSYFYYNPSQDSRQDLSYLNYFGVDISESSLAPRNPRHLIPSFGQDFSHGRSTHEDLSSYSNNSPGMEGKEMTEMMGDMMRGAAVDAVESVMDSGAMQVAMIVSAIVFAQTSILNFTYFLSTALPLVGVELG